MTVSSEKILQIKQWENNNKLTEEEFVNATFYDNQYVGITKDENNKIESMLIISAEELNDAGIKYPELNNVLEGVEFYKQNLSEELTITTEDNLALIEKFHERQTEKNILSNKDKRKSVNSVKGADGRKIGFKRQ